MPNQSFHSEQELVLALKQHNPTAIEALYNRYAAILMGVVYKMIERQYHEVTMQEIFLEIWENIHDYDSSQSRFFTWIYNIARKRCLDIYRHIAYTNNQNTGVPFTHRPPAGILSRLNPQLYQVLDLILFRGYSHQQIAQLLNLPPQTVKQLFRAALMELRSVGN